MAHRVEHISDDVTLHCGDCLEIMPTLGRVDIADYSPPYNTLRPVKPTGLHKESNWADRSHSAYFDEMPEPEYQQWQSEILTKCMDAADGLVWVNHKIRFRDRVGIHPLHFLKKNVYCEVIWSRPGSVALNNRRFALSHEHFFAFGEPHYWDNSLNTRFTVWRINPHVGSEHPVAYPIDLVAPLIMASCPPGGLVLDPFMGSGTTGVAAVQIGRRFVGIEIEPKYFDIACRRIADELARPRLALDEPAPAPKQEAMF